MTFTTPSFIKKHGVVLSKEMLPYDSALVFNAGVTRWKDGYVMLFRNDYGFCRQDFADFYAGISDNTNPKINIGLALSKDGIHWDVAPEPAFELNDGENTRAYDPRITDLGNGEYAICFAVASIYDTRGGIAVTRDFKNFEIRSLSVPRNRNMVIFPEKINGMYYRLERPYPGENALIYGIWGSTSPDLVHWGNSRAILMPKDVPYANFKIGPAAPPIRTKAGWLTTFHAVEVVDHYFDAWQRDWNRRYYAGLMLLDLEEPWKVIAMAKNPLLVPEEDYECHGFRGDAIFTGGMVLEDSGEVKIYYGAADTVECLATAQLQDLIDFCYE